MILDSIFPKITSKIEVTKIDVKTGKVIDTIIGHNTIRQNALFRMTGMYSNEYFSDRQYKYPKILTNYHRTYEENRDVTYLSLLKSDQFNERSHDSMTFTDLLTNQIPTYAQKVNRIDWNGRDLLLDIDFEFIYPSHIKWLKNPKTEDYPLPGQIAEIYYCPSFFTCSINEVDDFHESGAIDSYEIFKDGEYVWRYDIKKSYGSPVTTREIFGVSLYYYSTGYRSTLSHLEVTQNPGEIIDIYYSIYLDYSQAVISLGGIISSSPKKTKMLEKLIYDMFFYSDLYKSFGQIYQNSSSFPRFRCGYMYKPLISYTYAGHNSDILKNFQRWGHYLDSSTDYALKSKTDNHTYTYTGGNKVIACQEYIDRGTLYKFGYSFSCTSVANLVDKYNVLSRGFLHSLNFSYNETLNRMNHLKYPTYESSDTFISSNGFIELTKIQNFDGETLEQLPFDIMPWIYSLKFTVTGDENNAYYKLYKSPMIYVENVPDHGTAGLYFLSYQAIWNNYDAYKVHFSNHYYHMYSNEYYKYTPQYLNNSRKESTYYYLGHLYDPITTSYGFACLRSDFSDVDENGFYGLAPSDFEFQIRNINYTGSISSFILTNHERISTYKNTNQIDPTETTQIFPNEIEFRGAIILMSSQDHEVPPTVTIQRRRSAINESWTDITNQTISDLTGHIGTDFSYTKYHWSDIIKWDSNPGGDQWRVNNLGAGSVFFLTADDIAIMEENGGDGKDVLEYSNQTYGTVLGKTGNFVYFATVNGLLKSQIPPCFGQKEIDEISLTREVYCPYNNYNLDPALPLLNMIFPHETDGNIYLLYSTGALWLFNEETETISLVNTSAAPWNGINLVPETEMTKYWDSKYTVQRLDCWSFYWSNNRFVNPRKKSAAWVNTDGDIVTFVRGSVVKITNPGGITYIDFNFDNHNQKYLIAMIDNHQTVNDATDSNIRLNQVKYDAYDLSTGTRVIVNQWIDITTGMTGGTRTFANIFYDSGNSKHYVISSLGTGLVFKQGSIQNTDPEFPNYDYEYNNSETLILPACEDTGATSSVSVSGKQLCGNLNWFNVNDEEFSMFVDQKTVFFGATPIVQQYGWNSGTSKWELDNPNTKKCSTEFQDLIDNVKIRFDIKPGESAAEFVVNESLTFLRYKNGIFKDSLQDISNLQNNFYAGKLNRICEDEVVMIEKLTGTDPTDYSYFEVDKDSPSLWFLQVIKESSEFTAYVIPAYNYDFDLNGFSYIPDWDNLNIYENISGGPIGTDLMQVRAFDEGSNIKVRIWIDNESNVPYTQICNIFGNLRSIQLSISAGPETYETFYNSNQMVMEYDIDTSSGVSSAACDYMLDIFTKKLTALPGALTGQNLNLLLDDNMKEFRLIPVTGEETPYTDPNNFTAVGTVITVGPTELYLIDKSYLGVINNFTCVFEGNVLSTYNINKKVKIEDSGGDYSSFQVISSCYNNWMGRTYVSLNNTILDPSECPNDDFRTDTNDSTYFCGLSAIAPSAGYYCSNGAKFFYYDEADDWSDQANYGVVKCEYLGYYDNTKFIINLQYNSSTDMTIINVNTGIIFILPGDETATYPPGNTISMDLISVPFRRAFPLSGTIGSSFYNGVITTLVITETEFDLSGWNISLFENESRILFRMKDEATFTTMAVTSAAYNQNTDVTTINTVNSVVGTPTNIIFTKRWNPNIRDLNQAHFVFYYNQYDIRKMSKGSLVSAGPAGAIDITLEDQVIIGISGGDPTWMGYADLLNNNGYLLNYTDDNPPEDMESYQISELSNQVKLHKNHFGSLILCKEITYTTFN